MQALHIHPHSRRGLGSMAIEVKRNSRGGIDVTVDDHTIGLDQNGAKELSALLSHVLDPASVDERSARAQQFLYNLRLANDAGIQGLLRNASHDDVLVLLKSAEDDEVLKGRLYANMTDRSAQLYDEDLQFRFQEEMPSILVENALSRLMEAAAQLANDGMLTFDYHSSANS